MSSENLATFAAPAAETVRPRETTQQGDVVSKRGKRIPIGGHIVYPFDTASVMMPSRGHDEVKSQHHIPSTHARPMSGVESRISETPKKGDFGNTWSNGNL